MTIVPMQRRDEQDLGRIDELHTMQEAAGLRCGAMRSVDYCVVKSRGWRVKSMAGECRYQWIIVSRCPFEGAAGSLTGSA